MTGGVYPVDSGYMAFKVNLDLQNLMTKAAKA